MNHLGQLLSLANTKQELQLSIVQLVKICEILDRGEIIDVSEVEPKKVQKKLRHFLRECGAIKVTEGDRVSFRLVDPNEKLSDRIKPLLKKIAAHAGEPVPSIEPWRRFDREEVFRSSERKCPSAILMHIYTTGLNSTFSSTR